MAESYEVERIEKKMVKNGKDYYFIKWKHWPEYTNTWEPAEHLNCPLLVAKFEKKIAEDEKKIAEDEKKTNTASVSPSVSKKAKQSPIHNSSRGILKEKNFDAKPKLSRGRPKTSQNVSSSLENNFDNSDTNVLSKKNVHVKPELKNRSRNSSIQNTTAENSFKDEANKSKNNLHKTPDFSSKSKSTDSDRKPLLSSNKKKKQNTSTLSESDNMELLSETRFNISGVKDDKNSKKKLLLNKSNSIQINGDTSIENNIVRKRPHSAGKINKKTPSSAGKQQNHRQNTVLSRSLNSESDEDDHSINEKPKKMKLRNLSNGYISDSEKKSTKKSKNINKSLQQSENNINSKSLKLNDTSSNGYISDFEKKTKKVKNNKSLHHQPESNMNSKSLESNDTSSNGYISDFEKKTTKKLKNNKGLPKQSLNDSNSKFPESNKKNRNNGYISDSEKKKKKKFKSSKSLQQSENNTTSTLLELNDTNNSNGYTSESEKKSTRNTKKNPQVDKTFQKASSSASTSSATININTNDQQNNTSNNNDNICHVGLLRYKRPEVTSLEKGIQAKRILGATDTGGLSFLVEYETSEKEIVTSKLARDKIPHLIIEFYQKNITWVAEDS